MGDYFDDRYGWVIESHRSQRGGRTTRVFDILLVGDAWFGPLVAIKFETVMSLRSISRKVTSRLLDDAASICSSGQALKP